MIDNPTDPIIQAAADAIRANGGDPGASIHGWRCEYPDRYGPCDCVNETAADVVAAVTPLIRQQIAYQIDRLQGAGSRYPEWSKEHGREMALREAAAVARGGQQ